MISRYVYKKACKDACIMLTRTEKEVLDSVTINGWFDQDAYLEAIDLARPKMYITQHQRQLMAVCPDKDDEGEILREYYALTRRDDDEDHIISISEKTL